MNKIMENNDNVQEQEVQEQDASSEDVKDETQESDADTTDWKAQALKYKAIAERKDKKLQTQQVQTEQVGDKKTNTEQTGLTREEAIFFAKGGTEPDFAIAKKVADIEGVSILVAMEDDYYKAQVDKRKANEQSAANQLGASNGSPSSSEGAPKAVKDMTREEHEAHTKKRIQG